MATTLPGHSAVCFGRAYSSLPPPSSAAKLRVCMTVSGVASSVSRPTSMRALRFGRSQLVGCPIVTPAVVTSRPSLPLPTARVHPVVARRVCPFTGKKANRANKVSFSNHKTKKLQFVNLQYKRVWWEAGKRYVKLRLSTKALKTIEKNGLDAVARKAGIDLRKE
ncbi:ribosomal protein L28 [Musa troglodytarum]|uniref:Large ribosomal subunit protein bL28c n=1 Tax=Musa troglodytarum TaxID=320322 RepID=A0A9E7EH45_9LILI|nr:ribosomal protein L28 [Musa troglodytarum]